ncbi:cytochrome d ubiquinol oxidase subunit II [Mucilaginibacter pallidiroseus]|uniref:Cytochrome d ubiquinol oxidase subunit II n=2 Tax=Mucilaginibacter pallidiroseus TaxID=2599295 RepID=A0A563UHB6_9SPHI|nr:cytochrome d ubiquinol oxidase subunit II [Mucilaginibacter pallidiroseus]
MLYVIIAFLWVSLLLYLLMGGADFGAGILELFTSEKNKSSVRKAAYSAMGPIWEANHMWLIIAIVILFVGFPGIYSLVSTYLHIPVVVMLMGIIARGTAFTFRHYDAVKDGMQKVYNKIFVYSSFITPLFLGIIAGSAVSRTIDTGATDFVSAYITSWFNPFAIAVGFFTVSLCGFLAAVFLFGEVKDAEAKQRYIRKARTMNIALVVCVALVFGASLLADVPMLTWLFGNTISIIAVFASLASLTLLWLMISRGDVKLSRFFAGMFITSLLIAGTYTHYPDIILLKNGGHLSLLGQQTPQKTLNALGSALLVGSLFILPALFYLVYSFDKRKQEVH